MKRIISLFDRMLKRYKKDFSLVKEYFKFAIMIKSPKLVQNVFLRNLKYFSQDIKYWMIWITYEFEVRNNIFKARELFERALSMNQDKF